MTFSSDNESILMFRSPNPTSFSKSQLEAVIENLSMMKKRFLNVSLRKQI